MSQSQSQTPESSNSAGSHGLDTGNLTPAAFVNDIQKKHQETVQFIQTILKALNVLADMMSYPSLILFRRNLGERMLSGFAFLVTWFIASLVAVASGLPPAYFIVLGLPVLYAIHMIKVKARNKQGIRHYSFCRGDSWFDLLLPRFEQLNRGVLEPAAFLFAALAVYLYGDHFTLPSEAMGMQAEPVGAWVFSAYLFAMGLGLFFVEARLRQQDRHTLLDHIDQQIIGTYFSSALNEQTETANEGFAVAELADWNPQQKGMFAANIGLPTFNPVGNADEPHPFDQAWNDLLDPLPTHTPVPGS